MTVKYDEVMAIIKALPPSEIIEVRDFAAFLMDRKKIKSRRKFSEFSGIIDKKDIEMMMFAINKGCEQVDLSEW